MLRRNTPYGNIIYRLIHAVKGYKKMTGRPPFLRIILTKQIYEKGTTFQWKTHERGTFCQK